MNADEVVSLVFGEHDDAAMAVDHVFTVLSATYGPAWERVKGNAPIATVKTVWAHHLSEFTHSRAAKLAIVWALKNPTEEVPANAMQFRNLCRQAPSRTMEALPAPLPKQNPEMAAKIREALATSPQHADEKGWARRILQRVRDGDKTVRRAAHIMAMDALGMAHGG